VYKKAGKVKETFIKIKNKLFLCFWDFHGYSLWKC